MKRFETPDKRHHTDLVASLYRQYANKVFQQCISITRDNELSRDITQDVFLKVFTKLDSFNHQAHFSTWLYTITFNQCMNHLREQKRFKMTQLSQELIETLVDTTNWIDNATDLFEQALLSLNADEANLLRLKYQKGLSILQLSQQYRLTPNAVKMRLLRGRQKVIIYIKSLN